MLNPGYVLRNRYHIVRLLSQSMGVVYLALDLAQVRKPVVIKENLTGSTAQFQREADVLTLLKHHNLPHVNAYFVEPSGAQYLVMEYIAGQNLEDLVLHRGQPLAEKDALGWIAQILSLIHI